MERNKMKHCMLDLETFGTQAGCVIRSIGAVQFDPDTGVGETFYRNITEEDQIILGAFKDPDTVKWWGRQSKESQAALLEDQVRLETVVTDFFQWFKKNKLKFIWSQGSNFDSVLWEASSKMVNTKIPWQFYNTRDTRTAYDFAGLDTKTIPRTGTYHNALDDSMHQCRCVYMAYKIIRNAKEKAWQYDQLNK